jgi:hypothetical protein
MGKRLDVISGSFKKSRADTAKPILINDQYLFSYHRHTTEYDANIVPTGNYRILKKKVASERVQTGYPCFQWKQNSLSVIQTVMNRELCKAGKIVSERNRFISLCI